MLKSNLFPNDASAFRLKSVPSRVNFQGSETAKFKVLFCAHEILKYLTSLPRRKTLPHVFSFPVITVFIGAINNNNNNNTHFRYFFVTPLHCNFQQSQGDKDGVSHGSCPVNPWLSN